MSGKRQNEAKRPHQFYTRRIAEQAADAAEKIHGAIADHFRTHNEEEIFQE